MGNVGDRGRWLRYARYQRQAPDWREDIELTLRLRRPVDPERRRRAKRSLRPIRAVVQDMLLCDIAKVMPQDSAAVFNAPLHRPLPGRHPVTPIQNDYAEWKHRTHGSLDEYKAWRLSLN